MLLPKRVKYRKQMRGRMTGKASRGTVVNYGDYGLQALEPAWITSRQIEAARVAMTRYTKRGGKVWIKIFPDKPYSKKGLGTRMGSGKGAPEGWVAVVKNQKVMIRVLMGSLCWARRRASRATSSVTPPISNITF